jgi:hypothetical protein
MANKPKQVAKSDRKNKPSDTKGKGKGSIKKNRVTKSIEDSKRKKDFKLRDKKRDAYKKKQDAKPAFVDRRANRKVANDDVIAAGSESGSEFDEEMAQVEAEIQAEHEIDETEFQQFETGELDLPSEDDGDEDAEMSDAAEGSDDDLDDYYREIGVDPAEMKNKPTKPSAKESKDGAVY